MMPKMLPPTYSLRRIRNQSKGGITETACGSLDAIIKFDGKESPYCVYNELASLRLAQHLHVPVADGVLVATSAGPAYASLELASPGISLPNIHDRLYESAATIYPHHAAASVVFDIWIGNWDRHHNIKISTVTPHIPIFRLFDHSHALLSIKNSPQKSIQTLRSDELIVKAHPFFKLVKPADTSTWINRIAALHDFDIDNCCRFGTQFRNVNERLQAGLANALKARRKLLRRIISNNRALIYSE